MALVTATTKVQIISQVFTLLGKPRPTLDLDAVPVTSQVSELYDSIVPQMLVAANWRFCTVISQLSQLTSEPSNQFYHYAYLLPTGYLTIRRIMKAGMQHAWINYQIYGDQIYTNYDNPLYCEYSIDPGPQSYPIYFIKLLHYTIAAEVALCVTQDVNVASLWKQQAEKYFSIARNLDNITQPTSFIEYNEPFSAHYGL